MESHLHTPRRGPFRRREHHRDVQGGAIRAAIFGISDGLVTNASLILGVAGADAVPGTVRLAGLAGLIAGAISMAAGEFVSMSAQTELLERELDVERRSLEENPEYEEQELAEPSTGAQNDLQQVTRIAYSMVTVYGMNEKIGNVSFYDPAQENQFTKPYSEETSKMIDEEVRQLIDKAYIATKELLTKKSPELHKLAEALLEKEVLFQSDVEALIGKRPYEEKRALDVSEHEIVNDVPGLKLGDNGLPAPPVAVPPAAEEPI